MSEHDEQQPLLGSPDSSGPNTSSRQHSQATRRAVLATFLCALIIFVYSLGSAIMLTPMSKIYEDIICHKYSKQQSPGEPVPGEDRCKAPDVQSELANLQAWSSTLEYIPGLLVAVPYGALADKYGYKSMLTLSSIGLLLQVLAQMVVCEDPFLAHLSRKMQVFDN
jgi:MFS family permease